MNLPARVSFPIFFLAVVLSVSCGLTQTPGIRAGWHRVNGRWLSASSAGDFSDLLHFDWQGDDLRAAVVPTARYAAALRGARHAGVELGDARNLYDISIQEPLRGAGPEFSERKIITLRALLEIDFDGVDGIATADDQNGAMITSPLRPTFITAKSDSLHLECRGQYRGNATWISFTSEVGTGVRLCARVNFKDAAEPKRVDLSALTLADLVQQNPEVTRQYLSPVLRMFARDDELDLLAAGPADVYRAFPGVAPTSEMAKRVNDILPKLLDMDYRRRTAALEELRALGPTAICAASHLATSSLQAQQRESIQQILSENSRRQFRSDTPANLRRSPLFLIDCLEFPDRAIRESAIDELAKSKRLRSSLDAGDLAACKKIARKLRDELLD